MRLAFLILLFPFFAFGQGLRKFEFTQINLDLFLAQTWIHDDSIVSYGDLLWLPISGTNQKKVGCHCFVTTDSKREKAYFFCPDIRRFHAKVYSGKAQDRLREHMSWYAQASEQDDPRVFIWENKD